MEMNQMQQNPYAAQEPGYDDKSQKKGFAIASLVLGLCSLVLCCCGVGIITAPLAIIFGVISLISKRGGTGMSIVGLVTAGLCLIMMVSTLASNWIVVDNINQISEDSEKMFADAEDVFTAYENDGVLPEYLEKYNEGAWAEYWDEKDMTFYDVMDAFLVQYKGGSFDTVIEMYSSSPTAAISFQALVLE